MFSLDDRLAADTVEIARWPLCRVLLMNDRTYPWLILVPQREGVSEVHELSRDDRVRLMDETAQAADLLHRFTKADKMNVAALGNMVRQLHVHVIARFADDPAWPKPVWGVRPAEPYDAAELPHVLARLRDAITPPELGAPKGDPAPAAAVAPASRTVH
ncbi:HIT domain-containing protein [Caenispirillum bisanense]|uniref:Diadenosine tetraphosphate (Ap4A) hydrolase n=1 Tax=Caenispirillum bisanense TaxID=414052 RepID=A0A286GQD9_9PROT|nr:HIT family protein [Caenispirillum bisanense]SOD97194.1 Diadenosine tetraphosphate (Ap4A) hydrolase [Caenispirillum bisanense]